MDLPVLFDRYSSMGRLFPRKSVLLELLEKINHFADVRQGLIPGDLFRFCRLSWEVPPNEVGITLKWVPMMKGGDYCKYYNNDNWLFKWKKEGREAKAFAAARYGSSSRTIKNENFFFAKD